MSRKPPPFRPRTVELDILTIGARGDGLAKFDGEQVFVPLTLPGDRVVARLEGRRADGFTASMTELVAPGPSRREAPCPLFGQCGGCNLQHVTDQALAEWKRERLVTAMTRVGFDSRLVAPLVSIPPGTRRRAAFAFTRLAKGVVIGFNERASRHIVEVDPCLILMPPLLALLAPLRALLSGILPTGATGDAVATLTDSGVDLLIQAEHPLDLFARETLASFAEAQDLARLSWQKGDFIEPVAHRRPAQVTMGEVPVDIPPGGFLQPSREGEAALVSLVKEHLPAQGAVLDLYAGSGSFTFPMAKGRAVTAVEGDAGSFGALGAAARRAGLSVTANSPLRGSTGPSTGAVASTGTASTGAVSDMAALTSVMLLAISVRGLFFLRSSISLRNSSSSAWRAISSKLLRNSLAMARALPAHLPAICIRRGRSLGPTTTSATASRMTM